MTLRVAIALMLTACATPERYPFHHIEPVDDPMPYVRRDVTLNWERQRPPDEARELCRYLTPVPFDASTWTAPPENPTPTYSYEAPEPWAPYAP